MSLVVLLSLAVIGNIRRIFYVNNLPISPSKFMFKLVDIIIINKEQSLENPEFRKATQIQL